MTVAILLPTRDKEVTHACNVSYCYVPQTAAVWLDQWLPILGRDPHQGRGGGF
jgi:hypothetical protein